MCILAATRTRINDEINISVDGRPFRIGVYEVEDEWSLFKLFVEHPEDSSDDEDDDESNGDEKVEQDEREEGEIPPETVPVIPPKNHVEFEEPHAVNAFNMGEGLETGDIASNGKVHEHVVVDKDPMEDPKDVDCCIQRHDWAGGPSSPPPERLQNVNNLGRTGADRHDWVTPNIQASTMGDQSRSKKRKFNNSRDRQWVPIGDERSLNRTLFQNEDEEEEPGQSIDLNRDNDEDVQEGSESEVASSSTKELENTMEVGSHIGFQMDDPSIIQQILKGNGDGENKRSL